MRPSWETKDDPEGWWGIYVLPSGSLLWVWAPVVRSLRARGLKYLPKISCETLAASWVPSVTGDQVKTQFTRNPSSLPCVKMGNDGWRLEWRLFSVVLLSGSLLICNKSLGSYILILDTLLIFYYFSSFSVHSLIFFLGGGYAICYGLTVSAAKCLCWSPNFQVL